MEEKWKSRRGMNVIELSLPNYKFVRNSSNQKVTVKFFVPLILIFIARETHYDNTYLCEASVMLNYTDWLH